jgi:hypothetical protein
MVILGGVGAAPLQAQTAGKRPGRFRLGPVWLTPRLELKNAGRDTNVFYAEANPVADNSVVLSPALDAVAAVGKHLRLSGTGSLDLTWFGTETTEGSTDGGGRGRAEVLFHRVSLITEAGGSSQKQRWSIELDQRIRRSERYLTGGVAVRATSRLFINMAYTIGSYRYASKMVQGQDISQLLDTNREKLTGELRFKLTYLTRLLLSTEAIDDRFVSQPGGPNEVRSYRYLAGFEIGERALFSGRIQAGIRDYPPDSKAAPPYRGLALSVIATAPLPGPFRFTGTADRDVWYSSYLGYDGDQQSRNSYIWMRLAGQIEADLPLRLIGRAAIANENARYLLPSYNQGALETRLDNRWTLAGSLLRRFGESIRVGFTLTADRRNSNFSGYSYRGLRYGLQAEARP